MLCKLETLLPISSAQLGNFKSPFYVLYRDLLYLLYIFLRTPNKLEKMLDLILIIIIILLLPWQPN